MTIVDSRGLTPVHMDMAAARRFKLRPLVDGVGVGVDRTVYDSGHRYKGRVEAIYGDHRGEAPTRDGVTSARTGC